LRGTKQSSTLHGRETLHIVTAETRTLRAALDCFVASLLAMTIVFVISFCLSACKILGLAMTIVFVIALLSGAFSGREAGGGEHGDASARAKIKPAYFVLLTPFRIFAGTYGKLY
jgi:hypothetical protein